MEQEELWVMFEGEVDSNRAVGGEGRLGTEVSEGIRSST